MIKFPDEEQRRERRSENYTLGVYPYGRFERAHLSNALTPRGFMTPQAEQADIFRHVWASKKLAEASVAKIWPTLMRVRGMKHRYKLCRVKSHQNSQEGSSETRVVIAVLKLTVEQRTAPNTPASHNQYRIGHGQLMRQMAYTDIAELWNQAAPCSPVHTHLT
ncbi:hypothetical protein BDP27DRAFT_1362796 [Rhodocollybia butyracea]|uniref:Uncharacterized protein n=1 Tax=Rhodocollybia butyracea TaxID=206335 RepID=A0A9P5U8T3_9AGAR|nr:hypothetical protein BDP27DRAFT_1362796 [Rhodocollybia butyracea]